jgi:hypothetical protein
MRLTREKVDQLAALFREDPDLEMLEIENTADGKMRAYRVQVVESRKPIRLGSRPSASAEKP